MDWFIIVCGVGVLALGTPIALVWWKLARKAAPYRGEGGKSRRPLDSKDGEEVIVISASGEAERGA
jgi:hypothetical protein